MSLRNRYKSSVDTKDTNPKDTVGVRKAPLHNLSCKVLMEMGLGMLEGARRYGSHNYRVAGVRASVYFDASIGHIMSWWEGEDIDPDSGVHHLVKALTTLTVLRDSMHMDNWVDDRPVRLPDGLNKPEFNKRASKIIDKYPDGVPPYTEKNRKDR